MKRQYKRAGYTVIKFPMMLMEEVEAVMDAVGYWPNITDFIREAIIHKLEEYKDLQERR